MQLALVHRILHPSLSVRRSCLSVKCYIGFEICNHHSAVSCWCPHFHVESLAAAFCIVSVSLPHPQSQSHTELIPRQCKQALYAYTAKQLLETDCTLFKFDTVAASFISGTCGSACVMPSILPTILSDRGIKKTLTPAAPKDRSVIHLGPHACLHVGYCQTSGPS